MILKLDLVWRIIWDTELSQVARLEALYSLFKVLHILVRFSMLLIWTRRRFLQLNRIVEYARECLLSLSKSLSPYFSFFALGESFIFSVIIIPGMISPLAPVKADFFLRSPRCMFGVIFFLIVTSQQLFRSKYNLNIIRPSIVIFSLLKLFILINLAFYYCRLNYKKGADFLNRKFSPRQ